MYNSLVQLLSLGRLWTKVSNRTGQCKFSGQRDRRSFLVPRLRDNGTSSKSCHGTGRDGILTGCPVPSWDVPQDKITLKFGHFQKKLPDFLFQNIFSCFKRPFMFQNLFFLFYNILFLFFVSFGKVILSRDVPGQRSLSRDFYSCPCPGTKGQRDKEIFLSRNKGTMGHPVPWKP